MKPFVLHIYFSCFIVPQVFTQITQDLVQHFTKMKFHDNFYTSHNIFAKEL